MDSTTVRDVCMENYGEGWLCLLGDGEREDVLRSTPFQGDTERYRGEERLVSTGFQV